MAIEPRSYVSPIPIPPGETIVEEIEARDIPLEKLAEALGWSVGATRDLLSGKSAINTRVAAVLSSVLSGLPATFWLNLERNYRRALRGGE